MTHWTERARCAGSPLAWWFPHKNDETPALKICAKCPVRQECLDDAIETGETTYGIRGGLSPLERRTLKHQGGLRYCRHCQTPLPLGSHFARVTHEECKSAYKNAQERERRRKRRALRQPDGYRVVKHCITCGIDITTLASQARYCPPCAKVSQKKAQERSWQKRMAIGKRCDWCNRIAPATKPRHARCQTAYDNKLKGVS